MKHLKVILLICAVCTILFACSSPDASSESLGPAHTDLYDLPVSAHTGTSDSGRHSQDDMTYLFSWGYDVFCPGKEMGLYRTEGQLVRSAVYQGGELSLGIKIYVSREDDEPVSFGIMVLADGIPAEFVPDGGEKPTYMHPFYVVKEEVCKFSLTPKFKSESGRIDIIIAADLTNPEGDTAVLPVYVENQSGIYDAEDKTNYVKTSKLPPGFQPFPENNDALVTYWLWPENSDELSRSGPSAISKIGISSDGESWLYESTTGLPGRLRTIFFLDYKPYIVFGNEAFVDWNPTYGEMLSLPLLFREPEESSIFMPVTIRMDDTGMKYETIILRRFLINP